MTSETRTFTGVGTYTLSYDYNLAGEVKTVTDQHAGVTFNTSYDDTGRLAGLNSSSPGLPNTTFVSSLQYRAWGATKSVAYGNNSSVSYGYDNRGRVSGYSYNWGNMVPLGSTYQYHDNGQIKFAHDQSTANSIRDRAYQYDHAARLTEAYSGTEARNFVNNTGGGTADGPYRQSFTYDAWNNTLTGGGRFWSRTDVVTANFNQSNRNPNWAYDAEGNVTARNETFGSGMSPGYSYDAAGRKASLMQMRGCWLEPQHQYQLHVYTNSQTYDGDGQVTRYLQEHKIGLAGSQVAGWPVATYYLRSTVLGGRVISHYQGDTGQAEWNGTYVYAGVQRIGMLSKYGAGYARNFWRAADPLTGDEVNTTDNGVLSAHTKFDPQGVDIGLEDPFPPPGEGNGECIEYDPNYAPPGPFAVNLIPEGASAKCILDGIEQNCQSIGSEAATKCPDNDCGPRVRVDPDTGKTYLAFINAFVDGYVGFMPIGSIYKGHGQYESPGRYPDPESTPLELNHASSRPQNMGTVPIGNLRDNVQTLLRYKSPKQKLTCGEALQQLMDKAAEMFPKWQGQNSKSFMEAFDRIASQGGYIAGIYPGMSHAGGTVDGDAFAHDWPGAKKATVYLHPFQYYGKPNNSMAQLYYAFTSLHETFHLAARGGYDDKDMAKVVFALTGRGGLPSDDTKDTMKWSDYWDAYITDYCNAPYLEDIK